MQSVMIGLWRLFYGRCRSNGKYNKGVSAMRNNLEFSIAGFGIFEIYNTAKAFRSGMSGAWCISAIRAGGIFNG